jgi:uncharacterized protein with GYD domain
MALFLIQHAHTPETCPTQSPDMVRALRAHVTPENAEQLGLKLLADWANESEHTVVMVVEADSQEKAEQFAAPFQSVGRVEVKVGQTCEEVARSCLGE